jgi:hypothetical protein
VRELDRAAWVTAAPLALASATLWAGWIACPDVWLFAAVLVVVMLTACVLFALIAPRRRRVLAVSLVLVLPVLGPFAAAWALGARGRGGDDLIAEPPAPPEPIDGRALAQRLVRALPSCEALVSRDAELRRATISRLAGRASAEDVALLRWARTRKDRELAVDIALALEDIDQRFQRELTAARAAVAKRPSAANHVALFELIAGAAHSDIVDARLVSDLAAEARGHHEAAIAAEPGRTSELLAIRARFELAVRRPELAIAVLADAMTDAPTDELRALYTEAAYATRAFELIPRTSLDAA